MCVEGSRTVEIVVAGFTSVVSTIVTETALPYVCVAPQTAPSSTQLLNTPIGSSTSSPMKAGKSGAKQTQRLQSFFLTMELARASRAKRLVKHFMSIHISKNKIRATGSDANCLFIEMSPDETLLKWKKEKTGSKEFQRMVKEAIDLRGIKRLNDDSTARPVRITRRE
jgi:hypothetical protein